MRPLRQVIISVVVSALLYSAGCTKKSPQLPTQAKVPIDTVPSSLPPEISEETPPAPPPPEPEQEETPPEQPKPKPAQHHKKKSNTTTTAAANAAQNSTPPGAAAANSGNTTMAAAHPPGNPAETPPSTAIGADVNRAQLSQQKQTTSQLLEETEKTLNGLNRTLSHDEEEIVNQIRSYIGQSRNATKDGDFERAYNLATKAHLLSDALVKK